jgi:hypothetical protein
MPSSGIDGTPHFGGSTELSEDGGADRVQLRKIDDLALLERKLAAR